jgi:hypothetical protein
MASLHSSPPQEAKDAEQEAIDAALAAGLPSPAAEASGLSKKQKAALAAFRETPDSWVAHCKAWAPGAVVWGQQVVELYGMTDSSVMLDDINLSKRRLAIDHLPGDSGSMGPLSRALGHNLFVVHLDLSGIGLGDSGAAAFANTVRTSLFVLFFFFFFFCFFLVRWRTETSLRTLITVRLMCVPNRASSFPYFDMQVVFNHKLESLTLDRNGITDKGARALSFGLTFHAQDYLRLLSLKGNTIGDDGALCLLFSAWTQRETLANAGALKPAVLLPMDKCDLLTVDLEENAVGPEMRARLEHSTEAVFILRPAADPAACAIQRCGRSYMRRARAARREFAANTIKHQARRRRGTCPCGRHSPFFFFVCVSVKNVSGW